MSELVCRVEGASLAEGAERLESLIRGVKDRQFSDARTAPEPKSVSTAFAVSPEEAWSKKFMTAGIGPNDFKPVQMPAISIAAPAAQALRPAPKDLEPALSVSKPVPAKAAAAPPQARPGDVRPGHIGQALAKPAPRRRSWFGRLVKGD
ncbi:MAG TPA: hypothetical protein VHZ78_05690 [Rhizomicrobium sp.]|jgi:hypothetical protein|nr:hypothetical protein [Rhizomicrobium sp.]